MKKLKFLVLILYFIVFSCSSDDDENQVFKISTITYGEVINGNVYTIIYEGDNIKELVSNSEKVEFTYDANGNLAKRNFFSNGDTQVLFRTEFIINSFGEVIETKNWRFQNNALEYIGKETYHYNDSKLFEIKSFLDDDITMYKILELIWTNENPTILNERDGNGDIKYTFNVAYDLNKVNKFNSTFANFMFYDTYDTVFNIYQSLSKNTVTSAAFSISNNIQYIDTYHYTLLENGLTDNITFNGSLLWKFEYN